MKNYGVLFCIALLLVAMATAVHILFADRQVTLARLANSEIGDIRVLGESEDRFEQWSFRLSWRKGNGPWMEYLLDRQVALWDNVELNQFTNTVIVKRHGEIIGSLSIIDSSFTNHLHGRLDSRPQIVVTSEDPFDRIARIYPEQLNSTR